MDGVAWEPPLQAGPLPLLLTGLCSSQARLSLPRETLSRPILTFAPADPPPRKTLFPSVKAQPKPPSVQNAACPPHCCSDHSRLCLPLSSSQDTLYWVPTAALWWALHTHSSPLLTAPGMGLGGQGRLRQYLQ